jgi:hypothetical protein
MNEQPLRSTVAARATCDGRTVGKHGAVWIDSDGVDLSLVDAEMFEFFNRGAVNHAPGTTIDRRAGESG